MCPDIEKIPRRGRIGGWPARAGLSFGLVVLFFLLAGPFLARALPPLYWFSMKALAPSLEADSLRYEGGFVSMNARLPLRYWDENQIARQGIAAEARISASTACVAPAVFLCLLLAWPGLGIRMRLSILALAIPLLILIEMVDGPVSLAWGATQAIAERIPSIRVENKPETIARLDALFQKRPLLNVWRLFMSSGGRQFLGVAAFAAAAIPFLARRSASHRDQPL